MYFSFAYCIHNIPASCCAMQNTTLKAKHYNGYRYQLYISITLTTKVKYRGPLLVSYVTLSWGGILPRWRSMEEIRIWRGWWGSNGLNVVFGTHRLLLLRDTDYYDKTVTRKQVLYHNPDWHGSYGLDVPGTYTWHMFLVKEHLYIAIINDMRLCIYYNFREY